MTLGNLLTMTAAMRSLLTDEYSDSYCADNYKEEIEDESTEETDRS